MNSEGIECEFHIGIPFLGILKSPHIKQNDPHIQKI
jgi:hypothetical protein